MAQFAVTHDTLLYVLDGHCGGAELDCDDDSLSNGASSVTVLLEANQTVVIVVDGYSDTDFGSYTLNISTL